MQANRIITGDDLQSAISRKRAGTNPLTHELPPSGEGFNVYSSDFKPQLQHFEMDMKFCPGKRVKIRDKSRGWSISKAFGKDEEDVDAIIDQRLNNLRNEEDGNSSLK